MRQNYRNGIHNEEEYRHLDLLSWAMMEGACHFIAQILLGKAPPAAYINYGLQHEKALWDAFSKEMCGYHADN